MLTEVSKTSVITLRSHVIGSKGSAPILKDPMAERCLNRLTSLVPKEQQDKLFHGKLPKMLTDHLAIRTRKYDSVANDFISRNPGCTVVNLGCGFDTRYWRIDHRRCEYFELDLPEVIELKMEILKDEMEYELIGCSVLDASWIDRVTRRSSGNILLMAEGLFMYLPKADVIGLFKTFSERLHDSKMILEVVTEKFTRGIGKKMVELKFKQEIGLDAGSSYQFGIKNGKELETYGKGIKVIDEWCYVDDPDLHPRIIGYFIPKRVQWTVTATINERAGNNEPKMI